MKYLILSFFLATALTSFGQKITDTINSSKLKEGREITIALPASYEKNTTKKYPVLVLLDGDYLFDPFYGALKYGAYWDDLPEVIIVGISQNNNDERFDDCKVDEETGLPDGKGTKFFEFIGQELIPYIQKKYRTSPFKIIAGHDVTASFTNFFLYKEIPLFQGYISMGAELAPGMEQEIPSRLSKLKTPIFYYHSTADGDIKKMQKKVIQLDSIAKNIKKSNLNYQFDNFKDASHYSLVLQSIPNALYHFFNGYQPISMTEFNEKIAKKDSGYVDYLSNKYKKIETMLGAKMPIRINDFKAIEAAIMKNKSYNDFDALAILAQENYPKSMLADYEIAMMYEKKGDNKRAVKSYLAAFQKEEIGSLTKKMMIERAEELKRTLPKKGKKGEEPINTEPLPEETKEQPLETPNQEEQKNK